MNQLQIIGNLTRDVEVKQSQQGDNYLSFTVAVNTGKDQPALFVSVRQKQYPNSQSGLLPYLLKGQKVFVQGRISLSVYQSKQDNSWKPDLTCWADKIELVGNVEQNAAQPSQSVQQPASQGNVIYPSAAPEQNQQGESSSDLPF